MTRWQDREPWRGFLWRFLAFAVLILAAYFYSYLMHPWAPGGANGVEGWFGSFDQSIYRKQALLFSELNFGRDHFFPPLWPLTGAPFVRFLPVHLFLVPSIACLLVHLYALAKIGERYVGPAFTYAALAVMFLVYPTITLDQWVIPWSSSLSGALSSVMILLLYRLATKAEPWIIRARADHITLYGFYFALGATFTTRPLDAVILFPMALFVAAMVLWRLRPCLRSLAICLGIGAAGMALPALYLLHNYLHQWGNPFGGYLLLRQGIGVIYGPALIERTISLWIDATGIYPDLGQSLRSAFHPFIPALMLGIVALFVAPAVIRVIALTAVLFLAGHVGVTDLDPQNLLASNLIHYFKWAIAWLTLIAVGQVLAFVHAKAWTPLIAVSVASIVIAMLRIDIVPIGTTEVRNDAAGSITVTAPARQRIDMLDIPDGSGWNVHGAPDHRIIIDGREIVRNQNFPGIIPDVRPLRMPWGTRFFFQEGIVAHTITVIFPQPFKAASGYPARLGAYRFSLGCLLPRCVSR